MITTPRTARLRTAVLTAAGILFALAAPARAGGDVGVVVTGESWMQPQLVAQIESWLSQHGHALVPSVLPPDAVNALNDCFVMGDQACARGVVDKAAGPTSVIYARVDAHSNGSDAPDLTLTAYWFDKGHDAIGEKTTCQRCTDQSLRTTAEAMLKKLVGGGDLGHVVLKSVPPGAKITIDGTPIGITPLDWDLPPGKHTIQMDAPGRKTVLRDHVVVSNKSDLIVLALAATGDEDDHTERPSRALPLGLTIGGGAALATGLALIVFTPKADAQHRYFYSTWQPGIAVAAAGAVVGGIGAYLLWFRSPETSAAAASTTSTPIAAFTGDSGYIGWLGRF
jgi:hypothetical protein